MTDMAGSVLDAWSRAGGDTVTEAMTRTRPGQTGTRAQQGRTMRVLLIEHDERVADALSTVLAANGHSVAWRRYSAGVEFLPADTDLVLLDLGIPDADGLTLLAALRANTDIPVLVYSAHGDEPSVVRALQHGADDYLTKPLRMRELLARMDAATRRNRPHTPTNQTLRVGGIHINPQARTVTTNEHNTKLTCKEFDILLVLARNAGQAVSRRDILHHVWGTDHHSNSGALNVHMNALRTKLNQPDLLHTIHGYGYRLG